MFAIIGVVAGYYSSHMYKAAIALEFKHSEADAVPHLAYRRLKDMQVKLREGENVLLTKSLLESLAGFFQVSAAVTSW